MVSVVDLMKSRPSVQPEHSLAQVAMVLWRDGCDGLPVVDGEGRLLGFVSDRDIAMCAAIEGRNPHDLRVAQAMTGAAGIAGDASLAAAHDALRESGSPRLAVLDADGRVAGVLEFADLVRDAAARPSARKAATEVRATLDALMGVEAGADSREPASARGQGSAEPAAKAKAAPAAAKKAAAGKTAAGSAGVTKVVKKAAARPAAKKAARKTTARKAATKKAAKRASGKARGAGA